MNRSSFVFAVVCVTSTLCLASLGGCFGSGRSGDDSGGDSLGSCAYLISVDCGSGTDEGMWSCVPDVSADFCTFPSSDYDAAMGCTTYYGNVTWAPGGCDEAMNAAGANDAPAREEPAESAPPTACGGDFSDPGAACLADNCCAEVSSCDAEPNCGWLLDCIGPCNSDESCLDGCVAAYEPGLDELNALGNCWDAWCSQ